MVSVKIIDPREQRCRAIEEASGRASNRHRLVVSAGKAPRRRGATLDAICLPTRMPRFQPVDEILSEQKYFDRLADVA